VGLDSVEFVMNLEDAFGIHIPDEVAVHLLTPRMVVDWLDEELVKGLNPVRLDQRAFYVLRRAAMSTLRRPRSMFRPTTRWEDVIPRRGRRRAWTLLRHAVGASKWPALVPFRGFPRAASTLGETARYLAAHTPGILVRESSWSRAQIEQVVSRLLCEALGVETFGWDQQFVDELGLN
jgi:hypothetical protein